VKGCSVEVGKDKIPCGKNTNRIVLTLDKRVEHRCLKHARRPDVKESLTYKEWRRL
jgi:hypothetical protein